MKKVGVEPCITIGLEYLPDDVEVYCLTERRLFGLLKMAVVSGFLLGFMTVALGLAIRTALMVWR